MRRSMRDLGAGNGGKDYITPWLLYDYQIPTGLGRPRCRETRGVLGTVEVR